MKRILIVLITMAFIIPAWGQEEGELSRREKRKLERQERKARMEEEREKTAKLVEYMAENQQFVLEANLLFDKYGQSFPVSPNINFVAVDSLEGVIQIGSNMYIGSNGVGGVTLEGSVGNYEFTENEKKGYYSISYSLTTSAGTYDVFMTMNKNGNADATVRGNFGGSIRYSGDVEHPSVSRVYKGMSLY